MTDNKENTEKSDNQAKSLWGNFKNDIIKNQFKKSVTSLNPDLVVNDEDIDVEALKKKNSQWTGLKSLDDALEYYETAIEKDPKDWKSIYNHGVVLFEKEDYNGAIIDLSKCIEINDKCVHAYFQRGICFNMVEEFVHSLKDFEKALELDKKNWKIFFHTALVFQSMKKYDKAIENYTETIKLNEKDPMTYLNRANVYRILKNFDKAIEDFNQVLKLEERNELALFNRATTYFEIDKKDEAIADYTKIIENTQNVYMKYKSYLKRGGLYEKKGMFKEAIEDYYKVIDFEPKKAPKMNIKIMYAQSEYIKVLEKK